MNGVKILIVVTFIFFGLNTNSINSKIFTEKAPDFELQTLNGEVVRLSDYIGKVVILDFWATWCPPCRRGIPDLVEIQDKFIDDVVIIGISLDQQATIYNLEPFIEFFKINYPVVLGSLEVVKSYGDVQVLPTTFIINKKGEIIKKHIGLMQKEKLVDEITALINE